MEDEISGAMRDDIECDYDYLMSIVASNIKFVYIFKCTPVTKASFFQILCLCMGVFISINLFTNGEVYLFSSMKVCFFPLILAD